MELQEASGKHKMNKLLESNIDIPVDNFQSTMDPADKKCLSLVEEPSHKKLSGNTLSINSAAVHSLFKLDDERRKITQKDNKCCTFVKQYKILFWLERILLFCFCATIAGGFTVPVIIYAVDMDLGNNTKLSSDLDLDSCSNTVIQVCKW